MLKNILLFAMGVILFASCKKECDSSTHKVGFYYVDSTLKNEEKSTYKLYIDNVYKGDLNAIKYQPSCGDANLLYCEIDGKKHDLEVKNSQDELVNSDYLQITKSKMSSGSGKNQDKVVGHSDGTVCKMGSGDNCATFGYFKSKLCIFAQQ